MEYMDMDWEELVDVLDGLLDERELLRKRIAELERERDEAHLRLDDIRMQLSRPGNELREIIFLQAESALRRNDEFTELKKLVDKLETALHFYAAETKYYRFDGQSEVTRDFGKRAREALGIAGDSK